MAMQRLYGVATSFLVALPKADDTDLADAGDYTYAAGDIKVIKPGGAVANLAGTPTEIDAGHVMLLSVPLSATEMEAAYIGVVLADALVPDEVEHNAWIIETYGHPSAQHPTGQGVQLPNGLLSGTHSTTSADLGSDGPPAITGGSVLWNVTTNEAVLVTGYDSGTQVASWSSGQALASPWTDDDHWLLYPVGGSDLTVSSIGVEMASRLNAYDAPTKGELDSGLAALNDLTAAQVNAQVDSAISDALSAIADAVLDEVVEGSYTVRQYLRGYAAVLLGIASGMGANAPIFRDPDNTTDRVVSSTDADGNRSSVTLDLD